MQNQQHPVQPAVPYGQGQGQAGSLLRERDLFVDLLTLLKHSSRMYTTAVTEAGCPAVLQTMQRLLHETLAEQGDCFQIMNRRGWYPAGPSPTRQDIQKAIQQAHQTIQDMGSLLQWVGLPNAALRPGGVQSQTGGWQGSAPYGQPAPGQIAQAPGGYVQAVGWQSGAYAGASGAANPSPDGRGAFTGAGMHAGAEPASSILSSVAENARGAHRDARNWKRPEQGEYS